MISGGLARPARRLSILLDIQDQATAQLAAANGIAMKAGNSFKGTADSANRMKMALAGAAVAAGAAAIAINRLVGIGAKLDRTFSVIEETSGATADQMDEIVSKTQEISATMPVTMDEVSGAFEEMTYAGFEAAEAIDAAHSVTQLAVAGQMDMANAADIMTSMLNAFNLEASQSQQISSALAATFSNSAIQIDELGSAMQYSATQLSQLGFDAAEAAAATGLMADQGMRGTMAGTSMNQAFSKLLSTTQKTQSALAAAGLSRDDFVDEDGEMKSMVEIMEILNGAMDDVNATQAEMATWAKDVFGVRGSKAILPMINNFEELEAKIRDTALAGLKDFMAEADKVDRTRMSIIMDLEGEEEIEEMQADLADMDDEEIMQLADERGLDPSSMTEPMDVIEEFRHQAKSGDMGEDEMQARLQAMFEMEEEPAGELAEMIHDTEMSLEDLEEALDSATSGGELTAAQMENVAGRIEYLRGSMYSIMYTIYTGFRPAIELILDILIGWADLLTANTALLKLFGAVMFTATTAAASYAAYMAWAVFASSAFGTALIATTTSLWAHISALWAATAAAIKEAIATGSLTSAKWAFTASMAASRLALVQELRMMIVSQGVKATLTTITWGLAAAIRGAAVAMYSTNPVGWALLAVMLAISAILVAVRRDMFGLGSAASGLRDRLGALWNATTGWFSDWIVGPAIEAVVRPIKWLIGGIKGVVNWFRELSLVGQLIIAGLLIPISGPLAALVVTFAVLQSVIRVLTDVLGPLGDKLSPLTSLIGEIAIGVGQMVEALGMFVAAVIELAASGIGAVFKEITDTINTILNPLHWLIATGQLLYRVFTEIADLFSADFSDDVDDATQSSLSLARAFERLYDVFESIWKILEGLVDKVVDVAKWFKNTDDITDLNEDLEEIEQRLSRLQKIEDETIGRIPDGEDAEAAGEWWRDNIWGRIFGIGGDDGGSDESDESDDSDSGGGGRAAEAKTRSWHSEQDDAPTQRKHSSAIDALKRAADALGRLADNPNVLSATGNVPTPREAQPAPTGPDVAQARTGSHIESSERRQQKNTDNRSVTINQSPEIHIEGSTSGVDPDMVRRAVDSGMEQAEHRALESFIDWLTLGGPDSLDGKLRDSSVGGFRDASEDADLDEEGEDAFDIDDEPEEGTGDGEDSDTEETE